MLSVCEVGGKEEEKRKKGGLCIINDYYILEVGAHEIQGGPMKVTCEILDKMSWRQG